MASANSSNWPLDDCTPRVSLLKKLTLSPDTASKQRRMASHLQFALSLHHGRSTCHPQIWRVFTVGAHLVGTKLLNKFALLATSSIWLSASLERNGERRSPCLKPLVGLIYPSIWPFIFIEWVTVDIHSMTKLVHFSGNPRANSIFLTKGYLIRSYALYISNFIAI